jgi:antitoxin YqcF
MAIKSDNKALAIYLKDLFEGNATVIRYWDDAHHSSVDILSCEDTPEKGITSIGTIGLSETSISLESGGKSLRVELIMTFMADQLDGPNILSTCAFNVINSGMEIMPGSIFPRVLELYRPTSSMKHVLFSSPFIWEMETQEFTDKKVAWLHAIPISDAEYQYALANSSDDLETVLEENEVDMYDLDRLSVI